MRGIPACEYESLWSISKNDHQSTSRSSPATEESVYGMKKVPCSKDCVCVTFLKKRTTVYDCKIKGCKYLESCTRFRLCRMSSVHGKRNAAQYKIAHSEREPRQGCLLAKSWCLSDCILCSRERALRWPEMPKVKIR
jgi:hypothetical protein